MKTAVVYFSQTGNTAKVGAAIAAGVAEQAGADTAADNAGDVLVTALADAPSLEDRDLVFVGMPIVKFGAPDGVREFIETHCAGRRVALFVTHAAPEDLPQAQPWLNACRATASGAVLEGFFHCQGQLAEPVKQNMLRPACPPLCSSPRCRGCAEGQPDNTALARAADFGREVVRRVQQELATEWSPVGA